MYYDQLQQVLAEDQPFTFLYAARSPVFINTRLQHVQTSPWAGAWPFITWSILDWTVSS